MRDKTKRDKGMIVCGWGLIADSIFILSMYVIEVFTGGFSKLPVNESIKLMLLISIGGVILGYTGYYFLKKEYEKPKLEKVE